MEMLLNSHNIVFMFLPDFSALFFFSFCALVLALDTVAQTAQTMRAALLHVLLLCVARESGSDPFNSRVLCAEAEQRKSESEKLKKPHLSHFPVFRRGEDQRKTCFFTGGKRREFVRRLWVRDLGRLNRIDL